MIGKKLNTLLKVGKSGGTPSTKKKKYYKGDIPFLSIKDVTDSNGIVTSTEKHITEEGLNNSSSWIVPSGALTLSMYASVGAVARFGMDISTSQAFFNMIFNEKTSSDFMYYYLKEFNLSGSWNRLIATGTQSNLNAKSIKMQY